MVAKTQHSHKQGNKTDFFLKRNAGEERNFHILLIGKQNVQPLLRNSLAVSLKGKHIPPCDLYILLIGIYPEESIYPYRDLYTNVHNSLIKKKKHLFF